MWTWCTIMLLVILIMVIVIVIIVVTCVCALNLRKGTDQRQAQVHSCPECFAMAEREMMHPQYRRYTSHGVDAGGYTTLSAADYSQHSMAPPTAMQLTPYQQYMIAMNWSNLYKNYLNNVKEQHNQSKAGAATAKT